MITKKLHNYYGMGLGEIGCRVRFSFTNVKAGESYQISVWCKAKLPIACTLRFTALQPSNLSQVDPDDNNIVQAGIRGNNDWQFFTACKKMLKADHLPLIRDYAKA
ncbi:MAG: hypothetical protein U0350_31765 [Caldilineaceae bacterium]